MAATARVEVAFGAPVILVPGSLLLHHPSVHRLGRGSHSIPLSSYFLKGTVPLHWTTVCGLDGTVVFMCELLADEGGDVCPDCERIELS